MAMYWVFLFLTIGCDVVGTTLMKISNGFTRIVPTIFVAVFYILTLPFFTMALKKINISVAYAIWSGIGTASIAIVGYMLFQEQMNIVKITAIVMIIAGVIMLNLNGVTR
ncbi:MAG: multidrug efflux SMR transporter [Dehalobacterium sp.]